MRRRLIAASVMVMAAVSLVVSQGRGGRPASPAGDASTVINGKWIDITYGRPLKRGRDVFPAGADYAKITHTDGAPVWRAGANVTTRLKSEAALIINDKTVPAGEHSVFIEVKGPTDWTFIVSNWAAQTRYDPNNKDALWGSFGYTPDKDVVRAPMLVSKLPYSVDQLTWDFIDVTASGGKLAIMWDKTMASVPFKLGT